MPLSILTSKDGSSQLAKKRRRAVVFLLLFVIIIFLSIFFLVKNKSNPKIIDLLSIEERKELEAFFYDLFVENELGYTLFGDKPVSICWPATLSPRFSEKTHIFMLNVEGTRPLYRGLKAWEKISSKIATDYSLIICQDNNYPSFTILIKKSCFEEQFKKNIDLFKKIYGENINAEFILKNLERAKDFNEIFNHPLFKNNALLGIMLGYGRRNGELFQRREELEANPMPPFLTHKISKGFSSAEEELAYLWRHLQPVTNTHECLLRVIDVGFVGDPEDAETQLLVKKCEALHKALIAIFDRQDWLEVLLSKLCH